MSDLVFILLTAAWIRLAVLLWPLAAELDRRGVRLFELTREEP